MKSGCYSGKINISVSPPPFWTSSESSPPHHNAIIIIITVPTLPNSQFDFLWLRMDPVLLAAVLSILLGALIALVFLGNYFLKRRSEVESIFKPELQSDKNPKPAKPPQSFSKKSQFKHHSHAADKVFASLLYFFFFCLVPEKTQENI